MKMLVHFISETGFEACIEEKGSQYRAGWKSKPENEFTFLRCSFKFERENAIKETRLNTWTTWAAASKEYNRMIITHKTVNFK